ncbi:MAG: hypothetical protein H7323_12390 [Frankiales bacterium]|nr:hypothetical protein [Frankiales bacterium]
MILGTVIRLQVQRSRLKPGPRGARCYDPAPLLQVQALDVGPRGAVGHTAEGLVLDVHHADHADSRNRGLRNGLSLLPQVHYDRLRQAYGPHLLDGLAGESVLLRTAGPWTGADLQGTLELETTDGWLTLTGVLAAPPCVEFSRFCLDDPQADAGGEAVRAALETLDHGLRGFYAMTEGAGRVVVGARLRRV